MTTLDDARGHEDLHVTMMAYLAEIDLRYEQRYQSQEKAFNAAVAVWDKELAKTELVMNRRLLGFEDGASEHMKLFGKIMENVQQLFQEIKSLDRLTDAKFVTFRTLIDSQAEKVALALASSDKAVDKAQVATERRFDSVNEFRTALNDMATKQIPRIEAEQRLNEVSKRVDELRDSMHRVAGKSAGLQAGWGYLVGLVGIVGAIIAILVKFN